MSNIPDWVKIMMLKGDKGESPTISESPIDNGHEVTFSYSDGTSVSFEVYNATSGDYSGLTNKPKINGVTLSGNQTASDLGLADPSMLIVDTVNIGSSSELEAYKQEDGTTDASKAGYTPLGVIGWKNDMPVGMIPAKYVFIKHCYISGNTLYYRVMNTGENDQIATVMFKVYILYIKSELFGGL